MTPWVIRAGLLVGVLTCPTALAQDKPNQKNERTKTRTKKPAMQKPGDWGHKKSFQEGDVVEVVMSHGIRLASAGREIRAETAVIRLDRDAYKRLFEGGGSGLPTRGFVVPSARRALSKAVVLRRMESFMQALGNSLTSGTAGHEEWLREIRSVYLEGNIVVINAGVEVLTAKSLLFSISDNRMVFADVELRLISKARSGPARVLVVRAPKLVKQGIRISGRDVSITTCSAGKPHFEVLSGQIEIIERVDQFEILSRGNDLALSGRRTVPLPDAHFFSGEQNQIPIKGARAGFSEAEGWELNLDLGASMNEVGGAVHEFLTGRPAGEFQGDWRLGLTYNEVRGYPLEGELHYRVDDLYEGRMLGYYLTDDGGPNRQAIRTNVDGTVITELERRMFHSENRVHLAPNWNLDLSVFHADDAAVYPEFFLAQHEEEEFPETSLHLRHADANRLFTVTGRTNLSQFSYAEDRGLSESFVEEAPMATYDVFSEPLFEFAETDILLTSSTSAGWLRHEFDPRFATPVSDRTFRLDQEIEIAAPFHWGHFAVRPYTSARLTYYDNTVTATSRERWALDAGVSVTTRFARSWTSVGEKGVIESVRHTMYPSVSFGHLYQVDGLPASFYQFDELDSLNENGVVRVGLLNRFVKVRRGKVIDPPDDGLPHHEDYRTSIWQRSNRKAGEAREFLFLDLAQNFAPISDRDNNGHTLGLLEYELIWRPMERWLPVPNLRLLAEGEHDWNNDRLQTFNSALAFGKVLGLDWRAGYRTDHLVRGTVSYGASTELFGRWTLAGSGAYDLDSSQALDYGIALLRRDHDWVFRVGMSYSVITDEATFAVRFEPLFGGLFRRRAPDFAGMSGRGPDALLNY